jgi:hypothetical protein
MVVIAQGVLNPLMLAGQLSLAFVGLIFLADAAITG